MAPDPEIAIRFDNVSKKYRLRHGWYNSIREDAVRLARRIFLGDRRGADAFWALAGVNFDIRRGETIGLIGPNGAGKSTILKILSRVTTMTSGSFTVNGRVGALIEVGAGFHPDLTGRENVFLNGAIMGMRRREIEAKFDQITGFAEIGNFIDTPLKYYSSGMMVRLGFAVAAHIEPEILLVDEVLAVGDTAFQAKCLNKIAELKEQDKTIILVSHTMASILQHSTRVLWIDHGRVQAFGDPDETVDAYLRTVQARMAANAPEAPAPGTDSPIHIQSVVVRDAEERAEGQVRHGQAASVEVSYTVTGPVEDPVIGVTFHDVRGFPLGGITSRLDGVKIDTVRGSGSVRLVLAPVLFTRGSYSVSAAIHDSRIQRYLDMRASAATFMVDGPSVASRELSGHFVYPHRWEVGARS
jgi:ABC-type polysaccharide/polyol phosphate transport system ATPase subunit